MTSTGCGSSIGCASAWYVVGRGFDPHVRQHSFEAFGHEIISTAILSLLPIQEGQLSVTGKKNVPGMRFGHEIISTAILSLLPIQEGQLSVTGKRMCTK